MAEDAFPVSPRTPLSAAAHRGEILLPWLMNLLPEREPLRAVTRLLGAAMEDVLGPIEATGNDLAGALSIGPTNRSACPVPASRVGRVWINSELARGTMRHRILLAFTVAFLRRMRSPIKREMAGVMASVQRLPGGTSNFHARRLIDQIKAEKLVTRAASPSKADTGIVII